MNVKKLFLALLVGICSVTSYAQSYDSEKIALRNFLVRMYKNAPFEGVKVVSDYDNTYILSVLLLDPAKYGNNESTMNRVASVKAMSQVSRFNNGSTITDDLVIRTTEDTNGQTSIETIESIYEKSIGYVKSLEQLTNFTNDDGKQVFLYIAPLVTE